MSKLYGLLDAQRECVAARLSAALRDPGGTPQSRTERDAVATRYAAQLAQLHAAEHHLCFGRLDRSDGERLYIGRLGIFDEAADYEPMLVDWRAPAARAFYAATAAAPEGVRRRRHIRTEQRTVVALHDEVLDASGSDQPADPGSDAALLAALAAARDGQMRDIVATIQADQDRIIRSDHRGVLVVAGGPGTGKSVVALHRAAYLLYTHREQLAHRGVLILGPNATFLHYIDQVLPSLGETGVVLSTVDMLYPGVRGDAPESPEAARVKGDPVMAEVVAAAVRDRQQVPAEVREIVLADMHPSLGYQPETVRLDQATGMQVRERARRSRRPHNRAREVFEEHLLDALARQLADRLGYDPYADDPLGSDDAPGAGVSLLGEGDVAALAGELRRDPAVRSLLDELWPVVTPQQLLDDLYASPQRLAAAGAALTPQQRRLLAREPGQGWSAADIPLLDEAAELLGGDGAPAQAIAGDRHRAAVAYAQGVLDIAAGSRSTDAGADELPLTELVTAEQLAARHEESDTRTVAERAAADRRWAFGHVIVDEAQELSPMAWRMVMRRCPSRSMTLAGDLAQASAPAGVGSWEEALAPFVGDRWRLARLTVNYRTPAEIMAVATPVLHHVDPDLSAPRSVRRTGTRPARHQVPPAALADRLAELAAAELAELADGPGGRVAVIVPAGLLATVTYALAPVGGDVSGGDPAALGRSVAAYTPAQAKGLEFDCVLVAEPQQILAGSPRGGHELYVALTRATRRLGIVHTGPLPAALTHRP